MVHRPSDSRLLSNLLAHEKDYSKQLQSFLDAAHSSLASFSAFGAASPSPVSQVILSITKDFSGANDALRRYKDAVDAWREQLKALKDMEEEVSNIIRDREILVTRLLKASKNEKPPKDKDRTNAPSRRQSILSQSQPFASSSSLSLSFEHTTLNPSSSLPTSTKLAAAQAELQACEAQLASKEHELEMSRINAVRDGLRIRCHALIECGWVWGEMGKVALRTAESLRYDEGGSHGLKHEPYLTSRPSVSYPIKLFPRHVQPETESGTEPKTSSDLSSIGPSQSASQVNIHVGEPDTGPPPIIPNAPGPILGVNGSDIQNVPPRAEANGTPTPQDDRSTTPILPLNALPPPIIPSHRPYSPYAIPLPQSSASLNNLAVTGGTTYEYEYDKIQIPPAHAISELTMPTVATPSKPATTSGTASGYLTPVSNEEGASHSRSRAEDRNGARATHPNRSIDERRKRLSKVVQESGTEDSEVAEAVADDLIDPAQDEGLVRGGSKLQIIDNPRYQNSSNVDQTADNTAIGPGSVSQASRTEEESGSHAVLEQEILDAEESPPQRGLDPPSNIPPAAPAGESQRQSPKKSGFLGSLKGLFTVHHRDGSSADRGREREERAKGKKELAREKEEKHEEKEREKEKKREERSRQQEEKTRARQKQKQTREQEKQVKVLVPTEHSDDGGEHSEDGGFFSRKRHTSGADGGSGLFSWGRKSSDNWTTRTDKNLSEIQRESGEAGDKVEGVVGGYVVKRNMGLQKNLRGGITTVHQPSSSDTRTGRTRMYSDAGARANGSSFSIGSASGSPGGNKLRKSQRNPSRGGAGGGRGRREGRSSSVPPPEPVASTSGLASGEKATTGTRAIPAVSANRLKGNASLNASATRASSISPDKRRDVEQRGDSTGDTTGLTSLFRVPGTASPADRAPDPGPLGIPAVGRKPSKKQRKGAGPAVDADGANLGRETSVLGGPVAPAGMSTGLGGAGNIGRRGSVGVSVTAPRPSLVNSHRRSASWGSARPITVPPPRSKGTTAPFSSSSVSLPHQTSQKPQESLMSIVDSVTKSNRQAWDNGVSRSKRDRTSKATTNPPHPGNTSRNGMKADDSVKTKDAMSDLIRAPPRIDRQALLTSLQGNPAGSQPTTTIPVGKTPLKSALRTSRSPSPVGPATQRPALVNGSGPGSDTGYALKSGTRIVPMDILTSISSLPVENQKDDRVPAHGSLGGPVDKINDDVQDDLEDEDDSASTSSYETGKENFESGGEERRSGRGDAHAAPTPSSVPRTQSPVRSMERGPGLGSAPLATSTPVRQNHTVGNSSLGGSARRVDGSPPSKSTNSTPQRRKSVRVSLQPTFSPTPPAIDDDDDEDGRAPFIWKESSVTPKATKEHRRASLPSQAPPVMQLPKAYGAQKSREKRDFWDDSDDDVEYQTAKRLLQRTRKENELLR